MLAKALLKAVEEEVVGEGEVEVEVVEVVEVVEEQAGVVVEEGATMVVLQPLLGALVEQLPPPLEVRQEEQGRQRLQQGLGVGLSGRPQSGEEVV